MSEMIEGKKILILGGLYLHNKVVETAKEMGLFTIVVDNIVNSPAKQIADKSYDLNVADIDELEKICRKEKVDAVLNVCLDFCQPFYEMLCNRLGLPCYGSKEQFQVFTDKNKFKKICKKYGVDTIQSFEEADIVNDSLEVRYPIIVKPGRGGGSKGQSICLNRSEAILAIEKAKSYPNSDGVVIEKYMENADDFQVTLFVIDGKPYVVRTADRYLGPSSEGMERVAIALCSPSKYTEFYYQKVHKKICSMIDGLGIKNGPVFFQGFVDKETIRLYDPGLRLPGGDYERVFSDVTGINYIKTLIMFSLCGKMVQGNISELTDTTVYLKGNIIFTLHSVIKPGQIKDITKYDELKRISGVKYVSFRHAVGEEIVFTGDVKQRIAEFNIGAHDFVELVETLDKIESKFEVKDMDGNDMLFCKFDSKKLA